MNLYWPNALLVFIVAASLSLSACNDNEAPSTGESAAAVKVNGQTISVAEFDAKTGMHGHDRKQHPLSEQAMASIVNMELLSQAAVQSNLDAEEAVRARMANATRSILAMAYMEKLLSAVAQPSESEISAYFNQHPERFAERKQYGLQDLQIQTPAGMEDEIKTQLGKVDNYAAFETWLKQKNISHTSNPVSVSVDQLPDDMLQKLKTVSAGGHVILDSQGPMHVVFVRSEQKQPIALAQAMQQIGNMLWEQRRKDALDSMIKQQRDKAKIEYVAPYTEKGLPLQTEKE